MNIESLWKESDTLNWLPALSLPVLPWARDFLPVLELPSPLVERPDIWAPIYERAVAADKTGRQAKNWAVAMPGERGELMRQVVTKALFELAEQLGQDVAVDFERWVRRHFLCHEVESAMFAWQLVLRNACRPPFSRSGFPHPPYWFRFCQRLPIW